MSMSKPIHENLDEIDDALAGLEYEVQSMKGDGTLGAWWNPVDWVQGAVKTMDAVDQAVDVLKQMYDQLRQMYGQAQSTYMELATVWRGFVGNTEDLGKRITSLKGEREQKTKFYDDQIKKNPKQKAAWEARKKADLAAYNSQITAYESTISNIKKMWEGLWGKSSPFGKFSDGVTTGVKNVTATFEKGFKDFTSSFQKGFKDVSSSFEKGYKEFSASFGKIFQEFTKSFDGYVVEFKKGIGGITDVLKNVEKSSLGVQKQIMEQVNSMTKLLDLQSFQMKEMQSVNTDARKFYEQGAAFFKNATDSLKSIDKKMAFLSFPTS